MSQPLKEPALPVLSRPPSRLALIRKVRAADDDCDERLLSAAYLFAERAHRGQKRASGKPYFWHLFGTATILADMKMDFATVAAALLHDVLEDTPSTVEQLRTAFGDEVTDIVRGVTKLSKLAKPLEHERQAENIRRFVMAISDDIRVLLVKLADRLHNMRTLEFIRSPQKRRQIATETLEIYAPLAERIGIFPIAQELDDLAFAELEPDIHDRIAAQLARLHEQEECIVEETIAVLKELMAKHRIKATVCGRQKHPYSIWCKMQSRKVGMERLTDIMAFRVIVANRRACYRALAVIHERFSCVPGFFKDYISTPKPNGYQSLHTAVIDKGGRVVEVQVRSEQMDKIAEYGVAAHWRYKQALPAIKDRRWLEEWRELTAEGNSPSNLLSHTKLHMYRDQVFCFTPKGRLVVLPKGAVVVDFAYAVHSEIGDRCAKARVNGVAVPVESELRNGDRVNIITSLNPCVTLQWESHVKTAKAELCIKRFIKGCRRVEFMEIGRGIAAQALRRLGGSFRGEFRDSIINGEIAASLNCRNAAEVLEKLGSGALAPQEFLRQFYPAEDAIRATNVVSLHRPLHPSQLAAQVQVIDGDGNKLSARPAACCLPIPGDKVIENRGILHSVNCHNRKAKKLSGNRVKWGGGDRCFPARIEVEIANNPGNLGYAAGLIGKNRSNIDDLRILERSAKTFRIAITLEVRDRVHLDGIIAALEANEAVRHLVRLHG